MNARQIELTEEQYEELLNDCYGSVQIGWLTFDAGRIVRELDPTAFRCGMSEEPEQWQCSECDSIYETEEEAEECCKEEEEANV